VFGHSKPRKEVCYTTDGLPYLYSGVAHTTTRFPAHVLDVIPRLLAAVQTLVPSNLYTELCNAVDIVYDTSFDRGGSISAHSDDEGCWGLVLIFSLGQTRWLRVRGKYTKKWTNVEMLDNSLVAMHGCSFQGNYTHQVDKLPVGDVVGQRMSLNVRFM